MVEIDLILVCRAELNMISCRDEIHSVLWVVEIELFLVCWPKITCFYDEHEIDLVFVWVVQIDMSSVWGIELDLI